MPGHRGVDDDCGVLLPGWLEPGARRCDALPRLTTELTRFTPFLWRRHERATPRSPLPGGFVGEGPELSASSSNGPALSPR